MPDEKRIYYFYFSLYLVFVAVIYFLQNRNDLELKLLPLGKAAVSGLGISFLVTVFTNNYLWRWGLFRTVFGIKVPYIQGRWEGHLRSSIDDHKVKHPIVLEIIQTLKKVSVSYYDERAYSCSLIADFSAETDGGPIRLYCIYRNTPIVNNQKKLHTHNGAMELSINTVSKEISGIYYNNSHQRQTYGEMALKLKGRKIFREFKRGNKCQV